MNGEFQDRVVLVTGGSRGIGRAICADFAREGARIAFLYRNDRASADETLRTLRQGGASAEAWCVDVSNSMQVEQVFREAVEHFGRLDVLVNCAGINMDRTVAKLSPESWNRVLDVNLTGAFLCAKAALEPMRSAGFGRIINISSVVGHTGGVGVANYAASKSGLFGLTKSLALETARHGITVNAVAPGYFDIGMLESIPTDYRNKIAERIPLSRFGRAAELTHAIRFLASPQSSYITGVVLDVNGGYYM